jgi:capsular exopolysaccharide synthesis family protein
MPDTSSDRSVYSAFANVNGNNGNGSYVNGNSNSVNGSANYVYSLPAMERSVVDDGEDSIDLRQLANIVKHRFRLIGGIALGVTAAATILTFLQEPKYEGTFQLLVEPVTQENEEQNPLSILSQNLEGLDYETQIEVLRSPSVLNPIVAKLAKKYPEIEYDELIRLKKSPLQIEQLDETKILEVSFVDSDREKIQYVLNNLSQSYLAYSLAEKRAKVKQGIEFVESQLPERTGRVDELQGQVQKFRQKYNLLDPEKQASLLAQKQADFEEKNFENQARLNETKSLVTLLQKQLGLNPQQALASSYLSESPRYQNLLSELQAVEVELAQESVRFAPSNPTILALQDKKTQLLPLLQQEAGNVLGSNLSQEVRDNRTATSPSALRSELNKQYIQAANEIQLLQIRNKALNGAIAELESITEQMPAIARQYTDLQRQLIVATESLNRLLVAQETLQLEGAQQALPWQLIAPAKLKEDAVAPNPPRNLVLGLLGGVLLGLGAALLAERLDPVFHSSEELKESVKLPILGGIPIQKDLKPLDELPALPEKRKISLPQLQIGNTKIEIENPEPKTDLSSSRQKWYESSPFLEAFRSLNTNIRLLGSDSPIRSIVISSSIPSEGKSTISCHLAQAAAAMGQRVLLIDADLRRPQVHRWMGIDNDEGLSNILATDLDVNTAMRKIPDWENLSVITAGDIPPDPTRLLSSKKMFHLMEQLKNEGNYDLIIYDTPPILGFADGRILATRTNGVVLVVRIGKTDRSLLKQNIDNIKMSNVSVLGLVANQVNRASSGSYYYTHYYANRD